MADKPTQKASKKASKKARRSVLDDSLRAQFDREIAAGVPDPTSELPPEELNRRLAFLLLMCAHAPLFLASFPTKGRANTKKLEEEGWFKPGELPPEVIDALTEHRPAFLAMQRVWKQLGPYRDPPCPGRKTYEKLVKFMRKKLA